MVIGARKLLMQGLLLALMPVCGASAADFSTPVYVVSIDGGGLGIMRQEVIIVSKLMGSGARAPSRQVWIAERRRQNTQFGRATADHQWTTSESCPALVAGLLAIDRLPAVRIGSPTSAYQTGWVSDTPLTTLHGPPTLTDGSGVRVSRSEYMGPVARWRLDFERSVSGCWKDAAPDLPGTEIRPLLANDADFERQLAR